jgi:hypothetical protein
MVRDKNNQITCKINNEGYMGEYLTTAELSKRIKMSPGTIRNLVWKKELRENYHYLKPTPRKLLFISLFGSPGKPNYLKSLALSLVPKAGLEPARA